MSVAYIGPKSRTERPRKTNIGTEVAHVTRDSDTTFKVKRSTHRGLNASGSYSGERGNVSGVGKLLLRCGVLGSTMLRRPLREESGGGMSWWSPAYSSCLALYYLPVDP